MFGAELIEFVAFGKQLGMVLVGSAALWGLVFLKVNKQVGEKLLSPLFGGSAIAMVFWSLLSGMLPVYAHEGIALEPVRADIVRALDLFFPLFAAWMLVTLGGFLWWLARRESFLKYIAWFYALQFAMAAVLVSFPIWLGELSRAQLFFIGHNFHSIFTFGTVIILDFLYLISKSSSVLKRQLYPKFPTMSKVIWVGLGFDFLSVALVFQEAIDLTPKFFFVQTVIAVLVMNGVLLIGPVTRRMLESVKEGGVAMQKKWLLIADICGTVSISSWFSVTFVDFFEHLTLQYWQFIGLYAGFIGTLFLGHLLWEQLWARRTFLGKAGVVTQ